MSSVRLFAYGSLKRGERHHDQLQGARWLGVAVTRPIVRLVTLGPYLALVADPAAKAGVVGELFELPEAELARLDAFEGDEYCRGEVALDQHNSCGFASALAYFRRAR